jgi:hypothetical protein
VAQNHVIDRWCSARHLHLLEIEDDPQAQGDQDEVDRRQEKSERPDPLPTLMAERPRSPARRAI